MAIKNDRFNVFKDYIRKNDPRAIREDRYYTIKGYIHADKHRLVTIKHCLWLDGHWWRRRYYKDVDINSETGYEYVKLEHFIVESFEEEPNL